MEPIIGAGGGANGANAVKDSDTQHFQADVVDASRETPIVVDFWAPWCGPCKQLGPLLERVVAATRGKVRLVKINIDENPQLAQALRIQSIPAVYAFDQGQPVDGFVGALPESQIKAFVERLAGAAGPSPVEEALERAGEAMEAKDYGTASALYGQVLAQALDNLDAIAGLARCYLGAGEPDRAREILDRAGEGADQNAGIKSARAAVALAEEAAESAGDRATFEARLASNPDDHEARFGLALALVALGDREGAVDQLIEIMRRDRSWNDEAARKKLVELFEAFGPADPLTVDARRRMSTIMFS